MMIRIVCGEFCQSQGDGRDDDDEYDDDDDDDDDDQDVQDVFGEFVNHDKGDGRDWPGTGRHQITVWGLPTPPLHQSLKDLRKWSSTYIEIQ